MREIEIKAKINNLNLLEPNIDEQVKDVASRLGLKWEKAVFGDVMAAYRGQYPHLKPDQTVGALAEVKFTDPLPDMFKKKDN